MISSIVLTGNHKLNISNNKIQVGETKLSIVKEIPFVRYRFENYTMESAKYITETQKRFENSCHMIELVLNENILSSIDSIKGIKNIAKYLYINVDNSIVEAGELRNDQVESLNIINGIENLKLDRIMIKDKSSTLDTLASLKIKKQITEIMNVKVEDIGVCSSPLSFMDGNACLTAIKAREIAAMHTTNDNIVLPSANHQCMNCCGCIRYILIEKDTDIIKSETNTKKKESSSNNGEKKVSNSKKSSKGIRKWF